MLIAGGYFAQYDHQANWRYPGYLDALVAGARRLHADGVGSIIVAGEVADLGSRSPHPCRP